MFASLFADRRKDTQRSTRRRRLRLESLEQRTVLSGMTFVVNTTLDDVTPDNGLFSLREAIEEANANEGADTIEFAPRVRGTIALEHGELEITDDLTIDGPSARRLAVSGENASRVFSVSATHTLPFEVTGAGDIPEGISLVPGDPNPHTAVGDATYIGAYSGEGIATLHTPPDLTTGTAEFLSQVPFPFTAASGDQAVFTYGDPSNGAADYGVVTLVPADSGQFVAVWDAEFNPVPELSTGEFRDILGGSFRMIATTEAFDLPAPGERTEPMTYSWEGTGELEIRNEVVIEGLTIANGLATDAPPLPLDPIPGLDADDFALGGGILNIGASVELDRVRVMNNGTLGVFGFGGGVANMFQGSLSVTRSTFTGNEAVGYAIGAGGAIDSDSYSTLDVSHSKFFGNSTSALLGAGEDFQGAAVGGAVKASGGSTANVSHSFFKGNVAKAGDGADGTGQDAGFIAGGGALHAQALSLFVGPVPSHLTVSHSSIVGNMAIGGNGADGAAGGNGGPAAGGGLANWASTTIVEYSRFHANQAIGGEGGDGADGNGGRGGDALGGAIDSGFPSFGIPSLTVMSTSFHRNSALGGNGGAGVLAGDGGFGLGGAISSSVDPDATVGGSVNVSRSFLIGNRAAGGDGATGGNGLGGGIFNATGATTTLTRSFVFRNDAHGGSGLSGGSNGAGLGGGIFNAVDALFEIDWFSDFFTRWNDASTDGDDVFGELTQL